MATEEMLRFVLLYFTFPFFVWIGIIITLAALGKSCGVRRLYIKILLIIFEWGRVKITRYTDAKWGAQRIKKHEATYAAEKDVSGKSTELVFGPIEELDEEETNSAETPIQTITQNSVPTQPLPDNKHRHADLTSEAGKDRSDAQKEATQKMPLTTVGTIYNTAYKLLPNGDVDKTGHLIQREIQMSSQGTHELMRHQFSISEDVYREFKMADIMYFVKSGIEAIVEDEVTQRFSAEELNSWNLLTRTNTKLEFISLRLTFLWFTGWVLRYIILFPFRLTLAAYAVGLLICGTALIGYIPNPNTRRWAYVRLNLMCYRVMGRAFSAIVNFHNRENQAKGGGICVANHTSPIDIIILSADNTYAMVGQSQPGFIGLIQRAMSRAEAHVWFQRAEAKDRLAVARRLQEHVEDISKLPILIFPEGTCINNTSIMMFKKGSFEVGGTIYPVAIKYDPRFADAFWNSSQQNFVKHMLMIMTSWALVCDVWYLPPQYQLPGENGVQFANRVKANIAAQGGLVDLEWDGGLKRSQPKSSMMQKQQEEYSKKLKND